MNLTKFIPAITVVQIDTVQNKTYIICDCVAAIASIELRSYLR